MVQDTTLAISILSSSNEYVDIQLICHCTMSNNDEHLQFGSANVNIQRLQLLLNPSNYSE
jgi:hypothetical protein